MTNLDREPDIKCLAITENDGGKDFEVPSCSKYEVFKRELRIYIRAFSLIVLAHIDTGAFIRNTISGGTQVQDELENTMSQA